MVDINRFTWTQHALQRVSQRGLTPARVEHAIRDLDEIREANGGAAEWRVDAGEFVVCL
ncbi:MAG TPA: hypothetical protein VN892_07070 [Solirubrobacteraceae bacterium]|nr:hypothetical protein [Solirubrobacteraceae bacterium]